MTSGGRRANVVVVDTVQFKKDVQAFIELREDTFTTRVAIDGDVKDGWMPFEIPLEVKQDRWKVVVLRKQFDETASYAAYVTASWSRSTQMRSSRFAEVRHALSGYEPSLTSRWQSSSSSRPSPTSKPASGG